MDSVFFFASLLCEDYLLFNDDNVVWDGAHHSITDIQVNASKAFGLEILAINFGYGCTQDLANALIAIMNEMEKDEGLRVPRGLIAPNIQKEICEGDLTGITFMTLATRARSLEIKYRTKDSYMLLYDMRLARGIPSFFDLTARWIWDFRGYYYDFFKNRPFTLAYEGCENTDTETAYGPVDEPVAGARVFPLVTQVTSRPEIRLP